MLGVRGWCGDGCVVWGGLCRGKGVEVVILAA